MRRSTLHPAPFEGRLLEMLLEAHADRPQGKDSGHRRGPRIGTRRVAPLLVAGLLLGGWILASAVVGDDTLTVDAARAAADPEAVERELQAAGIEADVRAVPTEPFFRGKWVWLHFPPGVDVDPETFALLQSYVGMLDMAWPAVEERCPKGACERTAILELPRDVPGPIVLIAGRAPLPGEGGWENLGGENELAPTGALYCYGLEGLAPAQAGRRLVDLGYRVIWRYDAVDTFMGSEFPDRPPPGTGIVHAWFRGPNVVDVSLVRDEHVAQQRRSVGTPVTPEDREGLTWAPSC